MITTLLSDGFYENILEMEGVACNLQYVPNKFGEEVPNFRHIDHSLEPVFRDILNNQKLNIVKSKSGIFRRPIIFIHYDDFFELDDWCFAVALQPTTFNTFKHTPTGATYAFQTEPLNTINFIDWDVTSSIHLNQNQCVFYRPWQYHSFLGGVVQHYHMTNLPQDNTDNN